MLPIPRRYSHYVFGVLQSGLTCAVAAAIATYPFVSEGNFAGRWFQSWLIAWATMLPVVIFAAPFLQKASDALTRDDEASRKA
jgi:hypothetical protein